MENKFEALFIFKSLSGSALEKARGDIKAIITGLGVKVGKEDEWGKRTMAYKIQGVQEGYYVFSVLESTKDKISDLRRRLEVNDNLLRFLVFLEK